MVRCWGCGKVFWVVENSGEQGWMLWKSLGGVNLAFGKVGFYGGTGTNRTDKTDPAWLRLGGGTGSNLNNYSYQMIWSGRIAADGYQELNALDFSWSTTGRRSEWQNSSSLEFFRARRNGKQRSCLPSTATSTHIAWS